MIPHITRLVQRIERLGIPGYGPDEVAFMGRTVAQCQPEIVLDWGTNRGCSARIWYEATKSFPWRPVIHTIDVPDDIAPVTRDHAGLDTGMHVRGLRRVRQHRGDGVSIAVEMYQASPGRALFFIDGDHSFATVSLELLHVISSAPDATILLHDTNQPPLSDCTGPRQAVNSLYLYTDRYDKVELLSQAGMVRLTPRKIG